MNTLMTDNYISLPQAPAFVVNIDAMLAKILDAGGTSPTVSRPSGPNSAVFHDEMHGTKADNGRAMLHFRLPLRMNEAELIAYLEEPMANPKPPITVMLIRSAYNTEDVLDGEGNIIGKEPLVIKASDKAGFLPFMRDIPDGGVDGNGDPTYRPVTAGDTIGLSRYAGSDEVII